MKLHVKWSILELNLSGRLMHKSIIFQKQFSVYWNYVPSFIKTSLISSTSIVVAQTVWTQVIERRAESNNEKQAPTTFFCLI